MAIKDGNVRIQITLKEDMLKRLDQMRETSGYTRSAYLTYLIQRYWWEDRDQRMTERRMKEDEEI